MAVRINKDLLTNKQKEDIRRLLYMQPKDVGFFKKKKFIQSKDPILMWSLDKSTNEVVLPYVFGNILMGQHINSQRSYPGGRYNFTGTLLPHQVPIVQQASQHLNTIGTTTLNVYPGCGKTAMSAYLGSAIDGLTLVIFPIKTLEMGWANTYKQFTNASVWLNDGHNPVPSSCNVILTMDTQFHKIPKEILPMVRTLIIDEAHMFCVPSRIGYLLSIFPQYIIACTATLERTNGMETIIHSICGTHAITLKSPKKFIVYRVNTGIKTQIEKTKSGDSNWPKLVKDLCEDPLRNALIVDLVERNTDHKIMILTWNKAHAYFLSKILNDRGTKSDVLAGNKNSYKDSRVLVGTISKLGTAFDEQSGVCVDWGGIRSNMMILVGSTKSLSGLEQFTGRVFRAEFPVIIDLVDNNDICKRHWYERKKWYEADCRNGEIQTVNIAPNPNNQNPCSEDNNNNNTNGNEEITNNQVKNMNSSAVARAKLRILNKQN